MARRPRDKGTFVESLLVNYLTVNGFPYAERRSLKGGKDEGDVTGCPGLVWEAKYANAGLRMAQWVAETGIERINANADHGILVIKPRGLGASNVDYWYAAMDYLDHEHLRDKLPETVTCSVSEPMSFASLRISQELSRAHAVTQATGSTLLYAVTMVPPGAKDQPNRYYRVMYLRDMVAMVRHAGYGSQIRPLEEAG